MMREKPLNAEEKNIPVKDIATGITQEALFGKSCTKEDTERQRCFEDGNGKRSTSIINAGTLGTPENVLFEDSGLHDVSKTS